MKVPAQSANKERNWVAYANAFALKKENKKNNDGITHISSQMTPELYSKCVRASIKESASIIGGCCGIGPVHIIHLIKENSVDIYYDSL